MLSMNGADCAGICPILIRKVDMVVHPVKLSRGESNCGGVGNAISGLGGSAMTVKVAEAWDLSCFCCQ